MDDTTFWLVWSPQGVTPPSFRHPSEEQAQKEAERLAREHPSAEFYVLYAISCSKVTKVETTRLWREPVVAPRPEPEPVPPPEPVVEPVPEPQRPGVVCKVCDDTHQMQRDEDRVPCTYCPTPCPLCASDGGIGAFCATTPCLCACHLPPVDDNIPF